MPENFELKDALALLRALVMSEAYVGPVGLVDLVDDAGVGVSDVRL